MTKLKQFVTDNRTRIFWALVTVLVLLALFAFSVRRYGWTWTGFVHYTTPKSDTEEFHPGKTLWDFMELLIIPLVLVVGGFLLNRAQRQQELDIAAEEREAERQIAKDREEERALQSYLEAMTELLLEKKLRTPEEGSEVKSIARARTLTILRSLSGERKSSILRFLYEAKLIDREKAVVNLEGANLERAFLERAFLRGANLRGANLEGADLEGANLEGADLGGAFLGGANLEGAFLWEADLEGAFLVGANLEGASLRGANLEGAFLVGANLEGAKYDDATKWPEALTPPPEATNLDKEQG
jgi:hypothetical protein